MGDSDAARGGWSCALPESFLSVGTVISLVAGAAGKPFGRSWRFALCWDFSLRSERQPISTRTKQSQQPHVRQRLANVGHPLRFVPAGWSSFHAREARLI